VIDGGIDYMHLDLLGRVDLAASRSFLPSEDVRVQALFPGEHPIADLGYHVSLQIRIALDCFGHACLPCDISDERTLCD
jgi:hypothetical protein